MRNFILIAILVGGCISKDATVLDVGNQHTGLETGTMTQEFFGDGRDGDLTIPPFTKIVLARDMYWRNLTFNDGSNIDPGGFAIRVLGTMRGPGLSPTGEELRGYIARDGMDALAREDGGDPGVGYAAVGTIGRGGSATGGIAGGASTGSFPTGFGGVGIWFSDRHPGNGGSGGSSEFTPGTTGIGASIASASSGSSDLINAINMKLLDGTPISGGAPGAGGSGNGGGGGAGGGNIVVIARQVENADSIVISSNGGRGSDAINANGGGGGGGGGGYITIVVYRLPYPATAVIGGSGGTALGDAHDGVGGGDGTVLSFCFVL